MRKRRRSAAVTAGILACLAAGEGEATRTRTSLIEGAAAFRDGELQGVGVRRDGVAEPGRAIETLASDAGSQVWSLLRARDGTILAGSGSQGTVYRIRGPREIHAVETFEYEAFAIVEGAKGRLYASGAPNGTIVEILPEGTTRTLFDTPESIVWGLLADAEGTLYAATGERGLLYKIDREGKATILHRSPDPHLAAVAWSRDGEILLGTEGRGLLVAVHPRTGASRVLYDSPFGEVAAIAVAPDGAVYFASSREGPSESPGSPDSSDEAQPVDESPAPAGRVYVRRPDGTTRIHWETPEGAIHCLAVDPEGRLFAGTGNPAALFRIDPNGEETLLWKPEEGQVLALWADEAGILASTGSPGRVYRIGEGSGEAGWVRPKPVDAKTSVAWGRLAWETTPGSGRWEIATRTGETESPDSTWSAWSRPLLDSGGSLAASPPGRFLQVEARYRGGDGGNGAGLRRIWIAYAEPNLAPRVREIRFSAEEGGFAPEGREGMSFTQEMGAGLRVQIHKGTGNAESGWAPAPPPWTREVRTIAWTADDPNGDPLLFEVGLRRSGEGPFRTVAREHPMAAYAIDVRTLPEGLYEVQVTASDAPANPPGETRSGSKIGGPFRVDHTPPLIRDLSARREGARRFRVGGTAVDQASTIRRIEVSWDGGRWRPLTVADGFLDGREEAFDGVIDLDRDDAGFWVAVRAVDAAGNEAISRSWIAD